MNITMNIVSIIALMIIVGCTVWTSYNRKEHPENYKNERGNAFHILFGDYTKKENYQSSTKKGHVRSFRETFDEANEVRHKSREMMLNGKSLQDEEESEDNKTTNDNNIYNYDEKSDKKKQLKSFFGLRR